MIMIGRRVLAVELGSKAHRVVEEFAFGHQDARLPDSRGMTSRFGIIVCATGERKAWLHAEQFPFQQELWNGIR
jgi:hypothetical protein